MQFESQRLVFEPITQNHAQELAQVLCDPRVYLHVDDGIAPTFDELQQSFSLRESGLLFIAGMKYGLTTVTPGNDRSKRLLLKNAYAEVSSSQLPRLTSYDENDWVFVKLA